jgi:hypothetical protein
MAGVSAFPGRRRSLRTAPLDCPGPPVERAELSDAKRAQPDETPRHGLVPVRSGLPRNTESSSRASARIAWSPKRVSAHLKGPPYRPFDLSPLCEPRSRGSTRRGPCPLASDALPLPDEPATRVCGPNRSHHSCPPAAIPIATDPPSQLPPRGVVNVCSRASTNSGRRRQRSTARCGASGPRFATVRALLGAALLHPGR